MMGPAGMSPPFLHGQQGMAPPVTAPIQPQPGALALLYVYCNAMNLGTIAAVHLLHCALREEKTAQFRRLVLLCLSLAPCRVQDGQAVTLTLHWLWSAGARQQEAESRAADPERQAEAESQRQREAAAWIAHKSDDGQVGRINAFPLQYFLCVMAPRVCMNRSNAHAGPQC